MIDQLPEDLAALFAAERATPVARSAKAIVKAKLAGSLAGVPLGASVLGAAGKLIGVLALGLGIGAGAIAVSRSGDDPADVPPRIEIAAPATVPRVEPDRSSAPVEAPPAPTTMDRSARPTRRTAIAPPVLAAVETPVAIPEAAPSAPPEVAVAVPPAAAPESRLLAQAWSALSRRDAARALVLVHDGDLAYPTGPLSEERQAIRISALSQLRRRDETRAAAMQFLTNYPHSIHGPLVQRALEDSP